MKRNILLTLLVVVALLAVAGYALPALTSNTALAATQPSGATLSPALAAVPQSSALTDLESAFQSIYTQVSPSVVAIDVVEQGTATLPQSRLRQGLGSGFVWDTQGNIVTNNHVIADATQISVTFSDGTIVSAKVVGKDPDSDLAVIKADAPANLLRPVQMADSAQVKVGQLAIAIGNPYGEQNTMTTGIISALGRTLPSGGGSGVLGGRYSIPDVIQTDAPINPGNSGGALLNAQGQVIGVTAAIESDSGSSAGIGFAIPSSIVQRVIPALIKSGRYEHPYLGVSGATLTPTIAQALGLKSDLRGAVISSIVPNGPAEKAGLRGSARQTSASGASAPVGGDVILAIESQTVKSFDDIIAYLARATQVNQTVTLTILRDGQQQTIKVTLAARPN
ncbi:MAG: trypsin-like peptidase domain-containing protein [Chloroflexi bacterium]|nr:trypsin-like peptidase domain-containing protein [Chloroflexota bacterium]